MAGICPMADELFAILWVAPQNAPVFQTGEIVVVDVRAHRVKPIKASCQQNAPTSTLETKKEQALGSTPSLQNELRYDLLAGSAMGSMLTRRICLSKRTL